MRIFWTEPFRRDFKDLPGNIQRRMAKALERYESDPAHGSLGVKKMKGTDAIWEMRVSRNHRLTFEKVEGGLLLRRIGIHDILRNP